MTKKPKRPGRKRGSKTLDSGGGDSLLDSRVRTLWGDALFDGPAGIIQHAHEAAHRAARTPDEIARSIGMPGPELTDEQVREWREAQRAEWEKALGEQTFEAVKNLDADFFHKAALAIEQIQLGGGKINPANAWQHVALGYMMEVKRTNREHKFAVREIQEVLDGAGISVGRKTIQTFLKVQGVARNKTPGRPRDKKFSVIEPR